MSSAFGLPSALVPDPVPEQSGDLTERLVALARQAHASQTEALREEFRALIDVILRSGQAPDVVARVLGMSRAEVRRMEQFTDGPLDLSAPLGDVPSHFRELFHAGFTGTLAPGDVEKACAASSSASAELLAVSVGTHTLLTAAREEIASGSVIRADLPAQPIDPRQLPDLRAKLVAAQDTKMAVNRLAVALFDGLGTLVPALESADDAARVLLAQEKNRLARARLYHVDEEMTAAAVRKALRGRKEPLNPHRVPSRRGLITFGAPLTRTNPGGEPVADVVAVSWGPWNGDFAHAPEHITPPAPAEGQPRPFWRWYGTDGHRLLYPLADGHQAWWFTFWCRRPYPIPGLPPLVADNETVIGQREELAPLAPGSTDEVSHVVIACWDFMTQERVVKKGITEQRVQQRRPTDLRRDRRRGVEDDSAVHLVTLRGRLPRQDTGRRTSPSGRHLEYRQEIAEYDKSHCMNPHLHRHDPEKRYHVHEEITVTDYVRGPAGAPLRPSRASRTVHQLTGGADE